MDFTRLREYLDTLPAEGGVPGCTMSVYRDHKEIFRHSAGCRDAGGHEPMRGNETFCLYSCTKVFTSCAAMQLIERGQLSLDDPVSRYLPAYASLKVRKGGEVHPAERVMTVRHLMSMQSGLDYELDTPAIRRVLAETDGHASTRRLAEAMAEAPLSFEPGTDFQYSLSHDVLAAVIEAASGLSFSDYLKANIFDPLGLSTIGFRLRDQDRGRQCTQYEYMEESGTRKLLPETDNQFRLSDRFESGGAGLISDVDDYITFADALACGSAADGTVILSPEMVQLWSANQLGPAARAHFDAWPRPGYSYALGVRTRVDLTKGGPGNVGEFGWDGAAGSWAMIDPYLHVSAFFAMHVKNYGYSYDVIHPHLRALIYGELKE